MPSEPNSTGGLRASIRTRQKAFRGISLGPSSDNGAERAVGRLQPAARAELLEARDWYAARDVELPDRFIAEIETIVERIGTEPQQFPVVYQDIRRARCRRLRAVLSGHRRDRARDRLFPQ